MERASLRLSTRAFVRPIDAHRRLQRRHAIDRKEQRFRAGFGSDTPRIKQVDYLPRHSLFPAR